MATHAARTPHEVLKHHAEAMIAGDLEAIVSEYAEDARFITHAGVLRGQDGVREGFTKHFTDLPRPHFDVHTRILDRDVLFLEWTARAEGARAENGAETLLVRAGEIVLQTVHHNVRPQ